MPKRLLFNSTLIKRLATTAASRWQLIALCVLLAGAAIGFVQYQRAAAERAQDEAEERWAAAGKAEEATRSTDDQDNSAPPAPKRRERELLKARVVNAAWYDVPDDSLAKRRAGDRELTAAHNRLPIGTLVRVTHLKNGKSVVVRITDRGIRDPRVKIDLCKEAAEELEMVRKGIARVQMEVVPEQYAAAGGAAHTAAPHP